jgi:hypothetical protein
MFARSVHNVRIERLWVDVTAQVGATWHEHFTILELRHGLDINNIHHIWLLHFLFLATINTELAFFAQAWNHHRMQIRTGPNRSPSDMFGFDMFVHGVRGAQLPDDQMLEEELEVFGVDWEGLEDERLLESQRNNNIAAEEATSWVGRVGPPENLGGVTLDSPEVPLQADQLTLLYEAVRPWMGSPERTSIILAWSTGMASARLIYGNHF